MTLNRLGLIALSLMANATAFAQTAATPVVVDEVRLATLQLEKPASGVVHSRQFMTIMAGTAGRLEWIAEPGTIVEKGESLARIDVTPLQLQMQEQQLQARRAQINHDYFSREIERMQALEAGDYASANEMDRLRLNQSLAANDLAAADNRLAQLKDQVSRANILAPFTGVVSAQQRYVGEEVSRTDILARLNGTTQLELRAQLPLRWLRWMSAGSLITVDTDNTEIVTQVRQVIPAGEMQSQTFEARIDLPEGSAFALGELATLRMPQSMTAKSLQIPRDALVLRREAAYVFRVDAENKVEQISVDLGRGQGEWISVQANLRPGDAVVVRGAERLKPGQAVDVLRNLAKHTDRASG